MNAALASRLELAKATGQLSLFDMGLISIPPLVFSTVPNLRRLDLGSNEIEELEPAIAQLTRLEELWLNDNPLQRLPVELARCRRLRVLDLRNTWLTSLPREISRLPSLTELDLEGTSLRPDIQRVLRTGGPPALMQHLAHEDSRLGLRDELLHRLRLDVFREAADTEAGAARIEALTEDIVVAFPDLAQLKTVIRNAERLVPERLEEATGERVRRSFEVLDKSNRRKQLSAELELKLRALYYDVIEAPMVEPIIHALMEHLPTLEDVRFLLAHAAAILPPHPDQIDGAAVHDKLESVRRALREERAQAVGQLERALADQYPEQEPEDVRKAAAAISKLVRNTTHVRSLASDVAALCPSEFHALSPKRVVRAFHALLEEKGVA